MKKGVIFLVLLILIVPVVHSESFSNLFEVGIFSPHKVDISEKNIFKVDNFVQEDIIEEETTESTTTYFYAGSKLLASKNGELKYHYQDRMGSEIDGKQLPFGQEIKESKNRFSFTGKEKDSDLYYFGARYYDPNLGKFTSVDPVASELPYSYVSNNPMNRVDPTGMTGESVGKGTLVMPSAEGWQSINVYSLANYLVGAGLADSNIPAGFWIGTEGSRVSAYTNYILGFNAAEGGADPYSLNPGDVVYFPMAEGGYFNPGDFLASVSSRAERLGLSSDVAPVQTTREERYVWDEEEGIDSWGNTEASYGYYAFYGGVKGGRSGWKDVRYYWQYDRWDSWARAAFSMYEDGIRSYGGLKKTAIKHNVPLDIFNTYYNLDVEQGKIRFTEDGRLRRWTWIRRIRSYFGVSQDTSFYYSTGEGAKRDHDDMGNIENSRYYW